MLSLACLAGELRIGWIYFKPSRSALKDSVHFNLVPQGCTCFVPCLGLGGSSQPPWISWPLKKNQPVFLGNQCHCSVKVCVTLFTLFLWVMMCFLNLSYEKSLIFSLVRWVTATHSEKYARQIECVFPQFVGPNTSKEVFINCQVNINKSSENISDIIHYSLWLRFWTFFPM